MFNKDTCARTTLADCEWASIERCSCGTVHFTIGALSLRLNPTVISTFARMFTVAANRLEGERSERMFYAS